MFLLPDLSPMPESPIVHDRAVDFGFPELLAKENLCDIMSKVYL